MKSVILMLSLMTCHYVHSDYAEYRKKIAEEQYREGLQSINWEDKYNTRALAHLILADVYGYNRDKINLWADMLTPKDWSSVSELRERIQKNEIPNYPLKKLPKQLPARSITSSHDIQPDKKKIQNFAKLLINAGVFRYSNLNEEGVMDQCREIMWRVDAFDYIRCYNIIREDMSALRDFESLTTGLEKAVYIKLIKSKKEGTYRKNVYLTPEQFLRKLDRERSVIVH